MRQDRSDVRAGCFVCGRRGLSWSGARCAEAERSGFDFCTVRNDVFDGVERANRVDEPSTDANLAVD
jgi:hypothetical protein